MTLLCLRRDVARLRVAAGHRVVAQSHRRSPVLGGPVMSASGGEAVVSRTSAEVRV
jgi:hypothetical protein